jgi:hypothetical protein
VEGIDNLQVWVIGIGFWSLICIGLGRIIILRGIVILMWFVVLRGIVILRGIVVLVVW